MLGKIILEDQFVNRLPRYITEYSREVKEEIDCFFPYTYLKRKGYDNNLLVKRNRTYSYFIDKYVIDYLKKRGVQKVLVKYVLEVY